MRICELCVPLTAALYDTGHSRRRESLPERTMVSRRGLAIWIATILLALVFVLVGSSKLAGPSAVRWAARFVGMLEIVAGIALLVPRARRPAAAVIVATMIGALMTHLVHGEFSRVIP